MLYGLRWGIETSFRELKHVLGAKNFHAKEREYIEMEIWARLILYNFCSIITAHVVIEQKDKERKPCLSGELYDCLPGMPLFSWFCMMGKKHQI